MQSLWRTVWRFLKKLKIELPCDLAVPCLGKNLEKVKTNLKRYMYLDVHSSPVYNRQDLGTYI